MAWTRFQSFDAFDEPEDERMLPSALRQAAPRPSSVAQPMGPPMTQPQPARVQTPGLQAPAPSALPAPQPGGQQPGLSSGPAVPGGSMPGPAPSPLAGAPVPPGGPPASPGPPGPSGPPGRVDPNAVLAFLNESGAPSSQNLEAIFPELQQQFPGVEIGKRNAQGLIDAIHLPDGTVYDVILGMTPGGGQGWQMLPAGRMGPGGQYMPFGPESSALSGQVPQALEQGAGTRMGEADRTAQMVMAQFGGVLPPQYQWLQQVQAQQPGSGGVRPIERQDPLRFLGQQSPVQRAR